MQDLLIANLYNKAKKHALKNFEEDCSICKREGNNDVMCINEAVNKLYRQLPFIKKSLI